MHHAVATDQGIDDRSVQALMTNYTIGLPLVLLIDDRYSKFPYSLASKGVVYAVLGMYTISHAWGRDSLHFKLDRN